MIIEENKVVSLTYELRVNDAEGEIVEKVEKQSPLTFSSAGVICCLILKQM
jgi:FKBP-type peptidyl-prolyl cis-trans isomerase 2